MTNFPADYRSSSSRTYRRNKVEKSVASRPQYNENDRVIYTFRRNLKMLARPEVRRDRELRGFKQLQNMRVESGKEGICVYQTERSFSVYSFFL